MQSNTHILYLSESGVSVEGLPLAVSLHGQLRRQVAPNVGLQPLDVHALRHLRVAVNQMEEMCV